MAEQTATVAQIIQNARRWADAETPTPDTDFVTDAELLDRLNQLYREFLDLCISCGHGAIELLGPLAATVDGPGFDLPDDLYRLVGVDIPCGTDYVDAQRFNWKERNNRTWGQPRYRVTGRTLMWTPTDSAPASVRVWYFPQFVSVEADAVVPSYNGWDDYISHGLAVYILGKEERSAELQQSLKDAVGKRIELALKDFDTTGTATVSRVEFMPEEFVDVWGTY